MGEGATEKQVKENIRERQSQKYIIIVDTFRHKRYNLLYMAKNYKGFYG